MPCGGHFVQGYFEAIRQNPFQYHHNADELAEVFFNPDHQGYLTKQGKGRGKCEVWDVIGGLGKECGICEGREGKV